MNQKETVAALLSNTKIEMVSFLQDQEGNSYASVLYRDKLKSTYDILIDSENLHLLLYSLSISSINGLCYVRLKTPDGLKYLHQIILNAPKEHVVHHISHVLDNRKGSLQVCSRSIHSQFHRKLKIQRKIRKENI